MWRTRLAVRIRCGLVLTVGMRLPASAECLGGPCAEAMGYFLITLFLFPVLLIALLVVLYLRRRHLAVGLAAALIVDVGVLIALA